MFKSLVKVFPSDINPAKRAVSFVTSFVFWSVWLVSVESNVLSSAAVSVFHLCFNQILVYFLERPINFRNR